MPNYQYAPNQYQNPYGQYNQLMPYQQQYSQLQQYPQPTQQQMNIKGWAVSSEDDARKAMTDLDGSVFIFPDVQNGRVYSKQINTSDFSPIFRTYQLVETQERQAVAAPDMTGFVSRQDFDQTVQSLKDEIERLVTPAKKNVKEADSK